MAANWISDIAWDPQGRPYRTYLMDGPWGRAGERTYVSPAEVSPSNTSDPRLLQWAAAHQAPGGGYLHGRGVWNDDTGQWDQPINGGNLLSTAVGAWLGGAALPSALSSGATAAPQLGNVNATIDALQGASSSAPQLASTGAAAAAKSFTDRFTDPKSLATLAALGLGGVSSLTGGVDGPVDDDDIKSEIAKSLALQRSRVEQAQPAYDALVRMSYGMTPQSYRGAPPAGYQAPSADNPAYQYQAPRFGGR